ncbi:MAG: 3-phosphoshikimate 1-carboxyvinyltransferase, partial [Candidatus Hodarchaeales archaeon]
TITELKKVGVKIEVEEDALIIFPIKDPRSAIIETYQDHRIAMSFSILGLKIPGIVIKNPQCVKKSFPTFFENLMTIN